MWYVHVRFFEVVVSNASRRDPYSQHQRLTLAISTSRIEETSIGDYLCGSSWCVRQWCAFLSNSFQNLPDGQWHFARADKMIFLLTFISRLVAQDRHEEAKIIIVKYHVNGDVDHPLVDLQMREMIGNI